MVEGLLNQAVAEIQRRKPGYFRRFPAELAPLSPVAEDYLARPLCADWTAAEVMACLEQSIRYYARQGVIFAQKRGSVDPVTCVLLDSAIDAQSAERGTLRLRSSVKANTSVSEVLAREYEERCTSCTRYFIRRKGIQPLVLINAVGVSYEIWTQFLADPLHSFRIVLLENRATDIIRGGMRAAGDVVTEAIDIAKVLRQEGIENATLLSWCNGCRTAIRLAASEPCLIRTLVLLSPTFKGFPGPETHCSSFERTFDLVFKTIATQPTLAPFFARSLVSQHEPDWNNANSADVRANLLFRLPSKECANALLAPFADGSSLVHYGRRAASDANLPVDEILLSLHIPMLLITGREDEIVDNQLTIHALNVSGLRAVHAEVSGAGHYVHDLQYQYFLWALEQWTRNTSAFSSTARVRVTKIGQ
jgi:pimeloyl-ACP methyl ester carboxylesterase